MSGASKIEWTSRTWNPIRARLKEPERLIRIGGSQIVDAGKWGYHCERVSPGCQRCYACTMNGRTLPAWGTGLDYTRQSRDKVEIYLDEQELLKPLHWKKPQFAFPCSMTDLFAEFVPDEFIDRMFAVMALTPQHTYQVLTKRAERMRAWFQSLRLPLAQKRGWECAIWMGEVGLSGQQINRVADSHFCDGLPNVWLGVSVEDQPRADERIPHLLATPAALRFISYEPALGQVDFTRWISTKEPRGPLPIRRGESISEVNHRTGAANKGQEEYRGRAIADSKGLRSCLSDGIKDCARGPKISWVIAGGESGPGARPCNLAWLRSARDQCAAAGVPLFVKQLGFAPCTEHKIHSETSQSWTCLRLKDRKGGDPAEWPEDLRVRQMPAAAGARA
jgi:protein gp37